MRRRISGRAPIGLLERGHIVRSAGALLGKETRNCIEDTWQGALPTCASPLVLEMLCDRARAAILREDATIYVGEAAIPLGVGEKMIRSNGVEAMAIAERLGSAPVVIRVTRLPPSVATTAQRLMTTSQAALLRGQRFISPEIVQVGDELVLPIELSVGTERFALRDSSKFRSGPAAPRSGAHASECVIGMRCERPAAP